MSNLLSSTTVFGPIELPPEIARQRVVDEKTAAEFVGLIRRDPRAHAQTRHGAPIMYVEVYGV